MREIQRQGRSEYVVVTEFRKEFNIAQNVKLEYDIVDKGSNGFLSLFGARPTILKFYLPEKDCGVAEYIEGILKHMGVQYTQVKVKSGKGETRIQISGVKDRGYLIGREGRLLNALQHLTHRMLLQKKSEDAKVVIDVDNYRNKQRDGIQSRIEKLAKKALDSGDSVTLDPMSPADRRVVHQYIEKHKDLKTMTVGAGKEKRVVIVPEGAEAPTDAKASNANRSRRGRRGGRNRNRKPRPDADRG